LPNPLTTTFKAIRRWRPPVLPLAVQLSIRIGAALLMVTVAYGGYMAHLQTKKTTSAMIEQTDIVVRNLAASSASYILARDFATLEILLIQSMSHPDIIEIAISDPDGKIIGSARRGKNGDVEPNYGAPPHAPPAAMKHETVAGSHIEHWHPITTGVDVGWVHAIISLASIEKMRREIWITAIASGLVIFLLSTVTVNLFLHFKLSWLRGFTEFSRGLNTRLGETYPPATGVSEFKALGEAFNRLSVDLYEQERSLRFAKEEAEQANYSKSLFLNSMSHELRTPLNAILGFTQLIDRDLETRSDPSQKERLRTIMDSGTTLLDFVTQILNLSEIEQGKRTLSLENVDFKEGLGEAISAIAPIAATKGVRIINEVDAFTDDILHADRVAFRLVCQNLLSNGVLFNEEGGSVKISARYTGTGLLRITFSDTGCGIPRENHDLVFQAFARLGKEASTVPGTGIGLNISRRLVEDMHGSMGFKSAEGEGSDFWIDLPLAKRQHPWSGTSFDNGD
jgi:signal transduction histidine kinase